MLPKGPYDPVKEEPKILEYWTKNKFYKPEYNPKTNEVENTESMKKRIQEENLETYCNINPPPNAYARPHLGNVSGYAYQDAFGRYARMKGKTTLLFPGKDHAAQQAEAVFIREELLPKGKSKADFSREEFYKMCYKHFTGIMKVAQEDEKRVGLSSDFDRDLFTLDPEVVEIITNTFLDLFEDKMVYKGVRIVNWSPGLNSAVADIDTERMERETDFTYIKYPFKNKELRIKYEIHGEEKEYDGIVVATTRPETMLGDTAVVVDPTDERYKDFIGETLILPLVNREIPIISNRKVDKEFGTGAVKMTPAHAYEDYVMMLEWNEENPDKKVGYINVIWKDQKMVGPIGKYKGMHVDDCRERVINDLNELGLIIHTEKIKQSVVICERTKTIIEPIMSSQWFLDTDELKKEAIEVIEKKLINIHPDYMVHKIMHWLKNLRDWPISRSIWWGYRFPVWYKGEVSEFTDEDGQVRWKIGEEVIDSMEEALEKGLMKVQLNNPDSQEITVIRHGETGFNQENRFVGRNDIDITDEAKEASKLIANKLNNYDLVITSPLKRTKSTAEIIADANGIELVESELLQERDFGKVTGKTWEEFISEYPEYDKDNNETYQNNLPDAEAIGEVEKRVDLFLEELREKYWGKKVLIVTHTGIIRILKRKLAGYSYEDSRKRDLKPLETMNFYLEPSTINSQLSTPWIQDPDVFDTWFSSGQWAFAPLMKEGLYDTFYPTSIMETAYDILELWVSRMIMLGLYRGKKECRKELVERIPFKNVYLHGLIKAEDGQKMSKSKGNIVYTDDIINEFGADTLRLFYIVGNKAGAAYRMDKRKIKGYRNFLNKIWNASKLVLMNLEDYDYSVEFDKNELHPEDKEMMAVVDELEEKIDDHMKNFRLGIAAEELHQSFWHYFCDECLEKSKPRLYTKDKEGNPINTSPEEKKSRRSAQYALLYSLKKYLRLMHPIIPFITERVWQALPKDDGEYETIMY